MSARLPYTRDEYTKAAGLAKQAAAALERLAAALTMLSMGTDRLDRWHQDAECVRELFLLLDSIQGELEAQP